MQMYSDAQLETDQKRKDCMAYPKKISWSIKEKLHGWSSLNLYALQSTTLPYLPPSLSLYPGKQSGRKQWRI